MYGDIILFPSTDEGKPYFIEFIYNALNRWIDDIVTSPSSFVQQDISDLPTLEAKAEAYFDRYVYRSDRKEEYAKFIETIRFLYFNPGNPDQQNPFDPKAPDEIRVNFKAGDYLDWVAEGLYKYNVREMRRELIESRSRDHKAWIIGIRGNVAAGKSTSLSSLAAALDSARANIFVEKFEPEDSLDYYPEFATEIHYVYSRISTRGDEATMGSDSLQIYIYLPDTGEIHNVSISSLGGHLAADNLYYWDHTDSELFLVEYPIVAELEQLLGSLGPESDIMEVLERTMSNKESVFHNIMSFFSKYDQAVEAAESSGSKITGVFTKIPYGEDLPDDAVSRLNALYMQMAQVLNQHREQIEEKYSLIFHIHNFPRVRNFSLSYFTQEWGCIHDDAPQYSGTVDSFHRAIMEAIRSSFPELGNVKLISFGETPSDSDLMVSYKDIIP